MITVPHVLPVLPDLGEPLPNVGCGTLLVEGRGPLPLRSVEVDASVHGLYATARLVQRFENVLSDPVEVSYVFPLPARAAVTGFVAVLGGRRVEGRIEERGRARAEYDAATAAGQRAAIAEEERPEVFTVRVGNLLAGEEAVVELLLTMPLAVESGEATFRFPLLVAPRYVGGSPLGGEQVGDGVGVDTDLVPDASRVTPPRLGPGDERPELLFTVTVEDAGLPVQNLRSSLHVVSEEAGSAGPVRLRVQEGERLDRDFVLRFDVSSDHLSSSAVLVPDEEGDEGTFNVTLLPPPSSEQCPRDVVVVLDRSGSMAGWKMVAARRAAARVVDSLDAADRFCVLAFDNVVETVPGHGLHLVEATDRARFAAVEFLSGLDARGGTEAQRPLTDAARLLAPAPGRELSVVFVTDGHVAGEGAVLSAFTSGAKGVRVHAVGVDTAVNAGFLTRLSDATGGVVFTVESEDRLDSALRDVRRILGAPALRSVAVAADGVEVLPGTLVPSRPADAFPGIPLQVTGRYRRLGDAPARFRVGSEGAAPFALEAAVEDVPAVRVVWARARVRDLEDRHEISSNAGRWGSGGDGVDLDALAAEIVEHSKRFGVLSRFTAFLAVDPEETDADSMLRVTQPVESPAGWGAPMAFAAAPMAASFAMPRSARMTKGTTRGGGYSASNATWSSGGDEALRYGASSSTSDASLGFLECLPAPEAWDPQSPSSGGFGIPRFAPPLDLLERIRAALQADDDEALEVLLVELEAHVSTVEAPAEGVVELRDALSAYLTAGRGRARARLALEAALSSVAPPVPGTTPPHAAPPAPGPSRREGPFWRS